MQEIYYTEFQQSNGAKAEFLVEIIGLLFQSLLKRRMTK